MTIAYKNVLPHYFLVGEVRHVFPLYAPAFFYTLLQASNMLVEAGLLLADVVMCDLEPLTSLLLFTIPNPKYVTRFFYW